MDSTKYTNTAAENEAARLKAKTVDQRLSFCVTVKEAKQIKRLAEKSGRSLSGFVRMAVKKSMKLTTG